jgi:hypothetical protein
LQVLKDFIRDKDGCIFESLLSKKQAQFRSNNGILLLFIRVTTSVPTPQFGSRGDADRESTKIYKKNFSGTKIL